MASSPATPDVMVPMSMRWQMMPIATDWLDGDNRRSRWLNVLARLKPGVSIEQAQAAMDVLYRQISEVEAKLLESQSESFRKRVVERKMTVTPAATGLGGDFRQSTGTAIVVLMAMVGMVLLIACANVANLLVARGIDQRKEVAIRQALGAGRWRIVRQRLIESFVLAAAGGALGLLSVHVARPTAAGARFRPTVRRACCRPIPTSRRRLHAGRLASLTAIVFGLVRRCQRRAPISPARSRRSRAGRAAGTAPGRLREGLVVAQVALSLMLLTGAGLFARSLFNLRLLDPGYRMDRLTVHGRSLAERLLGRAREAVLRARPRPSWRRCLASGRCRARGDAAHGRRQLAIDGAGRRATSARKART